MPTLTNRDIQTAAAALRRIVAERLPIYAALEARSLMREIGAMAEDIEAERMKIIDRHAVRDENGQPVLGEPTPNGFKTIRIANPADFQLEETELLDTEQDVKHTLSAAHLCKPLSADGTQAAIVGELLMALGELLVE